MAAFDRESLGHRTAVALFAFLGPQGAGSTLRRRGVPAVWRHLQPHLAVRPELGDAVRKATTSPGADSRGSLADELDRLFSDDPALAELVQHDLDDEVAMRHARATRLQRWRSRIPVVAVAALLVWFTFGLLDMLERLWRLESGTLSFLVAAPLILVVGLAYLYRRLGRFASVVNWLLIFASTGGLVALLAFSPRITRGVVEEFDVEVAKILAILLVTLFPGWLYFQFVALRGRMVWEEYAGNLFRLGADDPAHLPEPPKGTRAHRLWREAGGTTESGKLYREKFEAVHGKAILARHWDSAVRRRRADGVGPVVFLTLVTAFGWTAVLLPFYHASDDSLSFVTIADPHIGGVIGAALAFGFAGAYAFNVQSLVRRYFQNDLRANAYISGILRVIVVLLLVAAVYHVWPGSTQQGSAGPLYAAAFLIGLFPRLALQVLEKSLVKLIGRVRLLRNPFPLTDLDGLNMWYEARLVEEGIEDAQNLVTADIGELLLTTRVPMGRCVDWIDQASLYLRIKDPSQREELRRLGIRCATDLQDAFPVTAEMAVSGSLARPWRARAKQVAEVVYPNSSDPVAAVDLLLASFKGETNLRHVRSWRSWRDVEDEAKASIGSPATV